LRRVSVARGLDPRRMALVPFGGAGPLFGCALADALGMRTVVIPSHPGVLSALGLAAAGERVDLLASHHRELDRLQPTDIGRAATASRGERLVALGRGRGRGGNRVTASLWPLDDLAPGVTLEGPAILAGRDATALIEPGWRGAVHASGAVVVERV